MWQAEKTKLIMWKGNVCTDDDTAVSEQKRANVISVINTINLKGII